MLDTSRNIFLNKIKNFPKWMDIRKRPFKSVGGNLLQSIIEEIDHIGIELEDFKKDFFIISYIGRENEIIDYAYVALVGEIDKDIKLIYPNVPITKDTTEYKNNKTKMALYQNGYLLFVPELFINEDYTIRYTVEKFSYSIMAEKYHSWNVFDEFALFSGIERFKNETNAQLLQRSLTVFKNRTNSTETGIKNTIINAVSNYVSVSENDIAITKVNNSLINLYDSEFGTAYEKLAQFNKDVFRTKKWDMTTWEHAFKTLDYVPHLWDFPLEISQNGTGHNDALLNSLTEEMINNEHTDVYVTGYQKSEIEINEYIRDRKIEQNIGLLLEKYDDTLKAKEVEYKITASTAEQISSQDILLNSYKKTVGKSEHYIENILLKNNGATVSERGILNEGEYKLKFYPKKEYSTMFMDKASVQFQDNNVLNLLVENKTYKKINNVFQNSDIKFHATNLSDYYSYKNMKNSLSGVTLDNGSLEGTLTIDTTGMSGQFFKLQETCKPVDIMLNNNFVSYDGFVLQNNKLVASGTDSSSTLKVELDCNYFYFEIEEAENPMDQGSCTCIITIDGIIDTSISGLITTEKIIEKDLNGFKHVKIEIQKAGMNPVIVNNINASRYEIQYESMIGSIIETPFGLRLPYVDTNIQNKVTVTVKSYSAFPPIIEFVHIGASLANAVYETAPFTVNANETVKTDISTNCLVKLYKIINNDEILVSDNFITKKLYSNQGLSAITLIIDTSKFQSITYSEPMILKTTENTKIVDYIILQPGESFDKIIIEGESLQLLESSSLKNWLHPNNDNCSVYISKTLKGFIVKDNDTEKEEFIKLNRNDLSGMATIFKFENLPSTISPAYIVDKFNNIEIIDQNYTNAFEELFLIPLTGKEHVAYNTTTIINASVSKIPIVNTFMPLITVNGLYVYAISEIISNDIEAEVLFEKHTDFGIEYDTWSLGQKPYGITINANLEYSNNNSYDLSIKKLNQKFIISNNIDLDDKYTIENQEIVLARYIITPPETIKVVYDTKSYSENIIVEEDGFNKLYYSNINSISKIVVNNVTVPTNAYTVLAKEGIIIWNTDIYDGLTASIYYSYENPKYLTFINLESLYELVGYSLDAYKLLSDEIHYQSLMDGDTRILDFGKDQPDKFIIKCSNPNFSALITDNILTVIKTNIENVIAVKSGYFYDDNLEFYQFNNQYNEKIDKMNNVTFINTKRLDNSLLFNQKSSNHILDSSMTIAKLHELCNLDFVNNKRIQGVSDLNAITACETYNKWVDFDMDIEFVTGNNGYAIKFSALSTEAYSIMDITEHVKNNNILSFIADGALDIKIAKEIKTNKMSYTKSLTVEPYLSLIKDGSYQYIVFDNVDTNYKYYLLIMGSGTLDDIIIKKYDKNENQRMYHTKNIDHLNLTVNERAKKHYMHHLKFDLIGNKFEDVEIDKSGLLMTGINTDWGLTKLYELKNDLLNISLLDVQNKKDAFYSEGRNAKITTSYIYLKNKRNIKNLYIKVNDVMINRLKNFTITVLGCGTATGIYKEIGKVENTNFINIVQSKLLTYIKIQVEMPQNHVINNIEAYAEYMETDSPLKIVQNSSGELITKIFDTGYNASFKLVKILCERVEDYNNIRFYVSCARENSNSIVWTDWKRIETDKFFNVINSNLTFDDYNLFRFKINLDSKKAQIAISDFVLEVLE